MLKKLLLTFSIILLTFSSFSQDRKTFIRGEVLDSLGIVKNANIINLTTKQGTSSSDTGSFNMFVSLGDSLQVSSVQHHSKKIRITKYYIESKVLNVSLKLNVYQLEEFELKKHNLTGILSIDTKNIPTNKKDSLLSNTMDFSNIDMKIIEGDDYIDS